MKWIASIAPLMLSVIFFGYILGNAQTRFPTPNPPDGFASVPDHLNGSRSLNIERVGGWPYGPAKAVDVDQQRDLIFLGSGGAVLILDGSDETNPQLLSDELRTAGLVKDIHYDSLNQRLLLATGEGGLEIWDVQNPLAPVRLTDFDVIYFGVDPPVEKVDLYGSYAIVECSWGFVHSIDVSDPTNPVQIAFNGSMGNPARDLHLSQEDGQIHSTGAQRYQRLEILPNGHLNTSGSRDFDFGPGVVYGTPQAAFVGYAGFLFILPLPNAAALPLSSTNINGVGDIVVADQQAYVINQSGLHIYDVTDLTNPLFVGSLPMDLFEFNMRVVDGYAYIPNGSDGLRIVDVRDGSAPVEVGQYEVLSVTWNTFIRGDYAYLSHSRDGMLVLDITDLERPELVGQYPSFGETRDLDIAGDLAYIADWVGGLRIVDISDPSDPVEIGVFQPVNAWRVTVSDNYAYLIEAIANQPYWLRVIDISDPSVPVEVGSLQFPPDIIWDMEKSANYVFLAAGDEGMQVVDVSDPTTPVEAGDYLVPDVTDLFIQDNYLYLASGDPTEGGMHILDISDPPNPALAGRYDELGFRPFHITVFGDFAYLNDFSDLHMFNVADPGSPASLEQYTLPGDFFEVSAAEEYIFVSDGQAGVQILENLVYSDPGGGLSWQPQVSGIQEILNSVHFADANHGWVAGEGGTILATSNGGSTWQLQNSETTAGLSAIYFADAQTGWATGEAGTILKTGDGGNTWSAMNSGTSNDLTDIHFVDLNTGWAVGDNGTILKSVDGGDSWQPQVSGTTGLLNKADFVSADLGWITLNSALSPVFGEILRTTDGGNNWQSIGTGSNYLLYDVDFVDANTGYVVGMFGAIQKTTDGGLNWQTQTGVPPFDWLYGVSFVDANTGWTVGFTGKIMKTTDGGGIWELQNSGTEVQLNGVHFVDQLHGWSVGRDGTILKESSGIVSVDDQPDPAVNIPQVPALYDNYPNPFNPATTIRYDLPERGHVRLTIFNILGRQIRTLVDHVQPAGMKAVVWDGKNDDGRQVGSGVYVYQLRNGRQIQWKKMILLK